MLKDQIHVRLSTERFLRKEEKGKKKKKKTHNREKTVVRCDMEENNDKKPRFS